MYTFFYYLYNIVLPLNQLVFLIILLYIVKADFKQMAVDYSSDDKKIYYQNNDLSLRQDLRKSDLPEYLQSVLFDQALPINSVKVVEGEIGRASCRERV